MTEPTPAAGDGPDTTADPADPAGAGGSRRRRWRLPAAVGGVLLTLVAAGTAYVLTRPAAPGFGSPEAIAELLAERGAPCADFDGDGDGHAERRGACYVNGEKIIIAVFDTREDVEAHWERQIEAASDNETVGMVIGDTWSISGSARAYLRHAAELLEAEYRSN